jgi:hypothetical protein
MIRSRLFKIAPALILLATKLPVNAITEPRLTFEDPQREMKRGFAAASVKAGASVEQHKVLAAFVGEFDQRSEIRMGPGEPLKIHAIARGRLIMGGRFAQIDITAAPDEEMKGERMLIYGYDPTARIYTLYNLDTDTDVATTATGTYDAASKKFTFDGERSGKTPFRWTLQLLADHAIEQKIAIKLGQTGKFREDVTIRYTLRKK